MQDRVSLYPGRVKLEPVAGQANLYDLTRADQPTQEGTPLNKASLLKDATAELFGLDANAVPDDVFHNLLGQLGDKARIATGSYTGTGTFGSSNPNSLTFEFEPKVVFIGAGTTNTFSIVMVRGGASTGLILGDDYRGYQVVSWNENTVTWYLGYTQREAADMQLNERGITYYYAAIG